MNVSFPGQRFGDLAIIRNDGIGHGPKRQPFSQLQSIGIPGQFVETNHWPDLIPGEVASGRLLQLHGRVYKHRAPAFCAAKLPRD